MRDFEAVQRRSSEACQILQLAIWVRHNPQSTIRSRACQTLYRTLVDYSGTHLPE